jgi:hypothetical protein
MDSSSNESAADRKEPAVGREIAFFHVEREARWRERSGKFGKSKSEVWPSVHFAI